MSNYENYYEILFKVGMVVMFLLFCVFGIIELTQ